MFKPTKEKTVDRYLKAVPKERKDAKNAERLF